MLFSTTITNLYRFRLKFHILSHSIPKKYLSTSPISQSNSTNHQLKLKYSPKICIVGSGPAALYTAQYALKSINPESNPIIDIYEKLPVPFGLV